MTNPFSFYATLAEIEFVLLSFLSIMLSLESAKCQHPKSVIKILLFYGPGR